MGEESPPFLASLGPTPLGPAPGDGHPTAGDLHGSGDSPGDKFGENRGVGNHRRAVELDQGQAVDPDPTSVSANDSHRVP